MNSARVIFLIWWTVLTAAAETRVRITGMRSKGEPQLQQMMGGRLEHVRSSPASPPLADDAAFMLRQLLRKDGYAEADVTWKINGPDEIQLNVREGLRLSLGTVTVTGVTGDDVKKFPRLFAKPAEQGRDFGSEPAPFREGDVDTGLSYLRQELNARGHWTAEATISQRTTDPATGSVNFSIEVKEGPLFRIGQATLTGNDPSGVKSAQPAVQPFVGKKASTANLNAMRLAVEQAVKGGGYPNAKIQMSRTLADGNFIPGFTIELGERVKLRKITMEGLERTNPLRVSRRFRGMEGDWYDEDAVNLRVRQLLATGAFAFARVDKVSSGEGMIDATLHFDEARAREVTLGIGAGSYQGLITRAGYTDRNLFGNLLGFNAGLEMSFLGLLGEVKVTDPWFLGSDVSATARAYALIYGREGYTAYESGLEGSLGWKFGEHYTVDLLAGTSLVNLTEDGLPASQLGESNYINPRITLTQALDFRDSPVLPKSGWHLESPLEIGAALAGLSTTYVSAGLTGGWYRRLNSQFDLGFGGEFGVLIPSGDGSDLPIDLRLFNGGARSVRSFPERELGPKVNGYPTGGEAMWNTNVELIRKITDSVKAVAFFDAGSLSRKYGDIGSADIDLAAGLGVRLDLPIGPVRLEYGYNLTRDAGEPTGTLHFAIGTAF